MLANNEAKKLLKIVDNYLDKLVHTEQHCFHNSTVILMKCFTLVITKNNKWFIYGDRFNDFNGIILGKYNMYIYDFLSALVKLNKLSYEEREDLAEYLRFKDAEYIKQVSIDSAKKLLQNNAYTVVKIKNKPQKQTK